MNVVRTPAFEYLTTDGDVVADQSWEWVGHETALDTGEETTFWRRPRPGFIEETVFFLDPATVPAGNGWAPSCVVRRTRRRREYHWSRVVPEQNSGNGVQGSA
jgi:hypothetical protein